MNKRIVGLGLTFDDVLVVPGFSSGNLKDIKMETVLTRGTDKKEGIGLKIPLLSAAMDTVTETKTAVAMAREGGIGIIHKNLSPESQAYKVNRVKRSQSGYITNPKTCPLDISIAEAEQIMSENEIHGLPIVDEQNELLGIVTHRDIRICSDKDLSVSKVMTKKVITETEGVTPEKAEKMMNENRIEKLPIVKNKGGKQILVGLYTTIDIRKRQDFPQASLDNEGKLMVGAAIGDQVKDANLERIELLIKADVDVLVVDTAHGHTENMMKILNWLKKYQPSIPVIGGNVATYKAAQNLISWGVDAVKVGMGPSGICTTRVIAGIGIPQVTAIMQCAKACHEHSVPLIADGGIRYSGDIVKAIAAGADSVMIGSIFAGTDESPGEIQTFTGKRYKIYRGMGSISAMREGSGDRYKQAGVTDERRFIAEGIEGRVQYKGPLSSMVYQLLGGLRAGMGYAGALDIPELKEAELIQITRAGVDESHPHNIDPTENPPNYPG